MPICFLGIGSNLGNRNKNIKDAISLLRSKKIIISKVSKIIETEPVGPIRQNKFLNAVLEVKTNMPPTELLKVLKSIEKKLGRKKTIRFGPRTIDLDILFYDNRIIKTKKLTIPHPRIWERDFVIVPLCSLISRKKFNLLRKDYEVNTKH